MKLLSGILLGVLGVALAGCGSKEGPSAGGGVAPAQPKVVVGVSLLTLTNPYFKAMADAMQAEAGREGYQVVITSGEFDPARQRDQVRDFIVRKVAAIVLTPCDSKAVGTAVRDANQAGIPVFTADIGCLAEGAKVVSHVATDNLGGGREAGKAMVEALGGMGKVAILDHPEVESVLLRTKGFEEVIGTSPLKLVGRLPGGGVKDKAFKAAEDLLQAHPDLKGIFAINDPSALGAVAAIEKAGRQGQVMVVGFDGMPEGKQAIKEGRIYADPIQFPDRIGAQVIQAIAAYLAGKEVPPQILIPTALYRKADAEKDASLLPAGSARPGP